MERTPGTQPEGCTVGTAPSLTPDCVILLRKQCPKNTHTAPAESDNCCSNATISFDKAKTSNPGLEAKPDRSPRRCSCLDAGVAGLNMNTDPIHPAQGSITHHLCCQLNVCRKCLLSTEFIFSSGQDPQHGGKKCEQGRLTLGEGSSMLSPCQPEMGTKGTVAGL